MLFGRIEPQHLLVLRLHQTPSVPGRPGTGLRAEPGFPGAGCGEAQGAGISAGLEAVSKSRVGAPPECLVVALQSLRLKRILEESPL